MVLLITPVSFCLPWQLQNLQKGLDYSALSLLIDGGGLRCSILLFVKF